jgi:exodeoxyribonuclease VII large subunit
VKTVGARQVWAVREITAALGRRLEELPSVWVEAEVQNLRQRSGQVYFTLNDVHQIDASMRGVLFDRLPQQPSDGNLVYAYGRVEFWAERARLSMRVERIEPAGEGALLAQVEATKARLAADGLLADARKRPLPRLPRRIGVITSAVGAARNDVLNNLWARYPADVVLVDVPVQGASAPAAVSRAIALLNATVGIDVIVVARGGGPLEDLMAFNDERLCRAVAGSAAPVVSAVGHEKDVTICDLVADVRVSTPTAAAAAVVPDKRVLEQQLAELSRGLIRGLTRSRDAGRSGLDARRAALVSGLSGAGVRASARVQSCAGRLTPSLERAVATASAALPGRQDRLGRAIGQIETGYGRRIAAGAALLDALSPDRTVARGYAILREPDTGHPVVSVDELAPGGEVRAQMRDGNATMTVKEVG